ncbi:MAG: class IV adenylate cyclase [Chloroflexota bacterium]|nr:class IV adenylate cyclase [Chloroflexota bacterium]
MKNLEIKARFADLELAQELARTLGAQDRGVSRDVDTYFRAPRGRLKLRQREGEAHGTLIYYERPDTAVSRYSEYSLARVVDSEAMRNLLDASLGTLVTVSKTRRLLLYGATRVHLDVVDGLGCFVELETVMTRQSEQEARREHELVREAMELKGREVVEVSYSDLLLRRGIG